MHAGWLVLAGSVQGALAAADDSAGQPNCSWGNSEDITACWAAAVHAPSAQAWYCYPEFLIEWSTIWQQKGAPGMETMWQR